MSTKPPPPAGGSSALGRDFGRAPSTNDQDKLAIALFDYYLRHHLSTVPTGQMDNEYLDGDSLEQVIRGYSEYLMSTSIPRTHEAVLKDSKADATSFLKHSTLQQYLSKAINLLMTKVPGHELWSDEVALRDISGERFTNASIVVVTLVGEGSLEPAVMGPSTIPPKTLPVTTMAA